MLGWCIVTLASARLKASVRFPPLRGMYQTGGTCKGCDTEDARILFHIPIFLYNTVNVFYVVFYENRNSEENMYLFTSFMANRNHRSTSPSYFNLYSLMHVETITHSYQFSIVEFPEFHMNVCFPNINFLLSIF